MATFLKAQEQMLAKQAEPDDRLGRLVTLMTDVPFSKTQEGRLEYGAANAISNMLEATFEINKDFSYLKRRLCGVAERLEDWRRRGEPVGDPERPKDMEVPDSAGAQDNVMRLAPVGESDTLLVVFSSWFFSPGKAKAFEMVDFLTRHPLGVHTLFFRDPSFSWYLQGINGIADSPEGIADFIKQEQRRVGATRLFTMGASMGGYAAILMGHLAHADVTLAFSPQSFVDQASLSWVIPNHDTPAEAAHETQLEWDMVSMEAKARMRGFAKYLRLSNLLPLSIAKLQLFVGDNSVADLNHCSGLLGQPGLHLEIWPDGGHYLPRFFRDRGELVPVLKRAFFGTAIGKHENMTRMAQETAEALRVQGDRCLDAGQYGEAFQFYSEALRAGGGPLHHRVLANRARALLKLGHAQAGWSDAHSSWCMDKGNAKTLLTRALCEKAMGHYLEAEESIQTARAIDPEDAVLSAVQVVLEKEARENFGPPLGTLTARCSL